MIVNEDSTFYLKNMESDCIDSLITDPPAGISFMNKAWDKPTDFIKDMTAIYKECLRVLKPGAHGLVWAIPRTSHWTATALERAGFEIRDVITHHFGTGFPKSLDVSKAIDKTLGGQREVIGSYKIPGHGKDNVSQGAQNRTKFEFDKLSNVASTNEAKQWQGWGTALKPASEHWILVRKPLSESTVAKNVLKHGCGGLNIDESRIEVNSSDPNHRKDTGGYVKTESEAIIPNAPYNKTRGATLTQGRFPSNLVLSHNEDCELVGTKEVKAAGGDIVNPTSKQTKNAYSEMKIERSWKAHGENGKETVEAWQCTEGCPVKELDEQSGQLHLRGNKKETICGGGLYGHSEFKGIGLSESGFSGASRFYMCFPSQKHDIKNPCKNFCANHVKNNLRTFLLIIECIAPILVEEKENEQLVQSVKSVVNQCDSCATLIAQDLVKIKNWVLKNEASRVYLDFIGSFKNSIPIQSLASIVMKWANTDIIPTITDLMILFGCVHLVTEKNTKQENQEKDRDQEQAIRFRYVAKASKRDRGLDNKHPTVKSTKLMEYLIKLITPQNGIILDPFMGSGSTGVAAKRLGYSFIGIEKEKDYFDIAEKRIGLI